MIPDPRDALLGRDPPFAMVAELEAAGLGHWTGGFLDRWTWNPSAVARLDTASALRLYQRIVDGPA